MIEIIWVIFFFRERLFWKKIQYIVWSNSWVLFYLSTVISPEKLCHFLYYSDAKLETNGALATRISKAFNTLIVFTLSSDLLLVIFCSMIGQFNCYHWYLVLVFTTLRWDGALLAASWNNLFVCSLLLFIIRSLWEGSASHSDVW